MSDARLRELERRWRETGAVEDEAAFVLEQLRAGLVARDALLQRAVAGDAAASLALGQGAVELLGLRETWDARTRWVELFATEHRLRGDWAELLSARYPLRGEAIRGAVEPEFLSAPAAEWLLVLPPESEPSLRVSPGLREELLAWPVRPTAVVSLEHRWTLVLPQARRARFARLVGEGYDPPA